MLATAGTMNAGISTVMYEQRSCQEGKYKAYVVAAAKQMRVPVNSLLLTAVTPAAAATASSCAPLRCVCPDPHPVHP
jgi:hypothetical protein